VGAGRRGPRAWVGAVWPSAHPSTATFSNFALLPIANLPRQERAAVNRRPNSDGTGSAMRVGSRGKLWHGSRAPASARGRPLEGVSNP
jgi:hypothetical protein